MNGTLAELFRQGDPLAVRDWMASHELVEAEPPWKLLPVIRDKVIQQGGRCLGRGQLEIAELLTSPLVRQFRADVETGNVEQVSRQLHAESGLAQAEFITDRGITQSMHMWSEPAVGKLLLAAGADINVLTSVHGIGDTALSLRLRCGDLAAVKFLLEAGADPNLGLLKFMPSKFAATGIPLMIEHGWNIDELVIGRGLIHHDAHHGHGSKVRTLLEFGANPNLQDDDGNTALHLLAERGTGVATVRALLAAGANPNLVNGAGQTPLAIARSARQSQVAEELESLLAHGKE